MDLNEVKKTNVGGLVTACISRLDLVNLMVTKANQSKTLESSEFIKPLVIFSTNGHSISIANSDPKMREMLNQADILHADGQSVVTFSKHFSEFPIPERSATTDTIHDVPMMSNEVLTHFLLGANKNTIEKCADIMSRKYSNFKIAGTQHGYFSEQDEQDIVKQINQSKADVLWVGLGKPKEQLFIIRNREKLKVPVIISCGGCYNFVTGDYKRAPEIFQKLGLEWLHRAFTEPRKLLWRYITTNPHAIYCVIKHRHKKNG
ncbi:WecB/TagA/CpsF family glycosyltransferase [Flavobacterium sp. W21_SRS_FM6]|uniref:WecB/TagA/CpsF family glycosyltransferase n=1 Tax=Flavobacterium sp. W21_SRS_FM6 TaxID=3240268 RepID=UPI003F911FB3